MPELAAKDMADLVAQLRPDARIVDTIPLTGSSTAHTWQLDLDSGESLALKTYAENPRWRPSKEKLVMDLIAGKLPLIQSCLLLDDSRTTLPCSAALLTWRPGQPFKDHVGKEDLSNAYRQAGALLREVHRIEMPSYGYILAEGVEEPYADNLSYMTASFERTFKWFRDKGGDPDFAKRLEHAANERLPLAAESKNAVLCHDDIHPGNMIVERDASGVFQLNGLIDWGNARYADPLFDLSKGLFCSGHDDPASVVPLREGYGPLDHSDPEGVIWLYTLHQRLTMWCFLPEANAGRPGLLADMYAMLG